MFKIKQATQAFRYTALAGTPEIVKHFSGWIIVLMAAFSCASMAHAQQKTEPGRTEPVRIG
ncbi:MAG: hypothetical protein ACK47R_22540, partial [Planctomycetia bacterium]